jgi:glucose/arabinose dehydrogenase
MRLANSITKTIAAAALAVWLAPAVLAQASAPQQPAATAPAAKPAKKKTHKAAANSTASQVTAQKPSAKKPAVGAAAGAQQTAAPAAAHRDPFLSLLAMRKAGPPLPPGKAGLVIAQIRVDGIVKAQNGMIAVVSNPQQRTYFVREGDRLYDGEVEKISLEGVIFRESSKDAFGKPVEREVSKRLYSSAGEQQ